MATPLNGATVDRSTPVYCAGWSLRAVRLRFSFARRKRGVDMQQHTYASAVNGADKVRLIRSA
jgi:hypothetical protein